MCLTSIIGYETRDGNDNDNDNDNERETVNGFVLYRIDTSFDSIYQKRFSEILLVESENFSGARKSSNTLTRQAFRD